MRMLLQKISVWFFRLTFGLKNQTKIKKLEKEGKKQNGRI